MQKQDGWERMKGI